MTVPRFFQPGRGLYIEVGTAWLKDRPVEPSGLVPVAAISKKTGIV
ncbi:hypothetical protein OG894_42330 (plasmid) [Streptomyces sp. NBC_01724]|nr:hypothetical protein [Streptomyces sp. NBC_01724]